MKNILKITIALMFILAAINLNAQNKKDTPGKDAPEKDGYVKMEKGQIIEYNNGEWGYVLDTYTCTNGEKISADGTVTKPDGSTAKLANGDKIYKDGHMVAAGNKTPGKNATTASAKTKHPAAAKQ